MDLSDKAYLREQLNWLQARLRDTVNSGLLEEYLSGKKQDLLLHDSLSENRASKITALHRHFLCCYSYLAQPDVDKYYNIYSACRMIPMIAVLGRAIQDLDQSKCIDLDYKLEDVKRVIGLDVFESAVFELAVAAKYALMERTRELRFVRGTNRESPDIMVNLDGGPVFIECKKFARFRDANVGLRNEVATLFGPIGRDLSRSGSCMRLDVAFVIRPRHVAGGAIIAAIRSSLRTSLPSLFPGGWVTATWLPKYNSDSCILYPSALWSVGRYNYSQRSEWHGLITFLNATNAGPSFLEEVHWDMGVRWRYDNEAEQLRLRRLANGKIFKGVRQLSGSDGGRILHIAYEREGFVGPRPQELRALLEEISRYCATRSLPLPNEVQFHELDLDVSYQGRFDFVEHDHHASFREPIINYPLAIFLDSAAIKAKGVGKWGEGVPLPPIDG